MGGWRWLGIGGVVFGALLSCPAWALPGQYRACIREAASYHRVNEIILEAIVLHESRGRADAVGYNANNTVDTGLTGINSVHWGLLSRKGVMPEDLRKPCVSIFVGAWLYSKKIALHGNTWWAVGAYHSETSAHNLKYQKLIHAQVQSILRRNQASRPG